MVAWRRPSAGSWRVTRCLKHRIPSGSRKVVRASTPETSRAEAMLAAHRSRQPATVCSAAPNGERHNRRRVGLRSPTRVVGRGRRSIVRAHGAVSRGSAVRRNGFDRTNHESGGAWICTTCTLTVEGQVPPGHKHERWMQPRSRPTAIASSVVEWRCHDPVRHSELPGGVQKHAAFHLRPARWPGPSTPGTSRRSRSRSTRPSRNQLHSCSVALEGVRAVGGAVRRRGYSLHAGLFQWWPDAQPCENLG